MEAVTIMCEAGRHAVATHVNFFRWSDVSSLTADPLCTECASSEANTDARIREQNDDPNHRWIAWNARLYNPALCTPADLANVRVALDAIARLCRALWCDDAESREDFEVLRLCAEEVRVLEGREEAA